MSQMYPHVLISSTNAWFLWGCYIFNERGLKLLTLLQTRPIRIFGPSRRPEHGTAVVSPERFRFIVGLMGPGVLEKSKTIHGCPWYGLGPLASWISQLYHIWL